VIITDPDGVIEYVNPKFCQVSGYSPEKAIGLQPNILKSGEMSDDEHQKLWHTIQCGSEWRGEFRNKKKNGKTYWEAASISPIKNEKGDVTNYLVVKEDITERKQAEEEIRMHSHELTLLYNAGKALSSTLDLDEVLQIVLGELRNGWNHWRL